MSATEIKKLLGSEKLVIGTDRVVKNLKLGKLEKVFLSSNCESEIVESIKRYSSMTETEVSELDISNNELGVFCKKQFSVSVIGILR